MTILFLLAVLLDPTADAPPQPVITTMEFEDPQACALAEEAITSLMIEFNFSTISVCLPKAFVAIGELDG